MNGKNRGNAGKGNPRWQRGMVSPNPAGRPPSGLALADRIRKLVGIDEMVGLMLDIARGQPTLRGLDRQTGKHVLIPKEMEAAVRAGEVPGVELPQTTEVVWPTTAERMKAIEFLCDRAWPQPKQVDLAVNQAPRRRVDLSKLTDEQLDQWIKLNEALTGDGPGDGGEDVPALPGADDGQTLPEECLPPCDRKPSDPPNN
jgi:hypothetical protein